MNQFNLANAITFITSFFSCFGGGLYNGSKVNIRSIPYQMVNAGSLRFCIVLPHSLEYIGRRLDATEPLISNRYLRIWTLSPHRGHILQSPRIENIIQPSRIPIEVSATMSTLQTIWRSKVFVREYFFDTQSYAGESEHSHDDYVNIYDILRNRVLATKQIRSENDFIDRDNDIYL